MARKIVDGIAEYAIERDNILRKISALLVLLIAVVFVIVLVLASNYSFLLILFIVLALCILPLMIALSGKTMLKQSRSSTNPLYVLDLPKEKMILPKI